MLWLVLSLTACYDQNAWPTIHGDVRNSDTSPAPGFTDLALLWTRDFPGYVAAAAGSPSVTPGGRGIPAGADGSSVLAVQDNGASGSIIWKNSALTNLGVSVQVRNNISYVAVRKPGTVLGVDVLSINALSGSEYSRVTIIPPPVATVGTSIAADGTIVVAGLNGVIAALGEAPAE